MNSTLKQNIKQIATEPLEVLRDEVAQPIGEEAINQLKGFWDKTPLGTKPHEIAKEDLQRARNQNQLEIDLDKDAQESQAQAEKLALLIKEEYRLAGGAETQDQAALDREFVELREQIAKLAESAGIGTKTHLETPPEKVSILDIKRLRLVLKELTEKVEGVKTADEMVAQSTNAKRSTGMLAWVSGKQMKVHEQGTLQLQG